MRKANYALDEEALRPYFQMENVREGVFAVASRLFGLKFEKLSDIPVYHSDVEGFRVADADGTLIRRRVWEDDMLSAAELASRLSAVSHRVIFVGEGCRVTAREIALPHCTEADESIRYQNGVSVARAALRVWKEAEDRDAFTDLALKPTYLRPSQAERERAEKQQ